MNDGDSHWNFKIILSIEWHFFHTKKTHARTLTRAIFFHPTNVRSNAVTQRRGGNDAVVHHIQMIFKHIKLSGAILLSHAFVMIVRDAMLANDENDNHVVSLRSIVTHSVLPFILFLFGCLLLPLSIGISISLECEKCLYKWLWQWYVRFYVVFCVLRCLVDICSLKSTYFKIHTHTQSHTISCENDCFLLA